MIIRPLKEDLRNNIKTFWVVVHVMHLQVICLLGAAGGNLKGPIDRLLGSCLKAMLKYLVFDVDFDFDGRLDEYQFNSPYQDLIYHRLTPQLL